MLHNTVVVGQRTSEVITKSHHGHYTQKSFSVINGHRHISHKTEHTTLRFMQPHESLTCNCTAKDSYLTNGKQTGPNGDLTTSYNSTRLHSKQTRDLPELSTTAVPCTDCTLCLQISRSEFSFLKVKQSEIFLFSQTHQHSFILGCRASKRVFGVHGYLHGAKRQWQRHVLLGVQRTRFAGRRQQWRLHRTTSRVIQSP